MKISYQKMGARGNVHVESFNGHCCKYPNRSLFCEAQSLEELRVIVEAEYITGTIAGGTLACTTGDQLGMLKRGLKMKVNQVSLKRASVAG